MQVRELVQLHRRYGTHLVLTVFLAVAITGCGGRKDVSAPPPAPASAAPPAQAAEEARPHPSKQVQALYRELAQVEDEFGAILERLSTGEVAADEELVRLGERLQVGAHQCVETEGCDPLRFFDVMGRLVEEQNVTLADQASQLEALSNEGDKIDEDLSLEAGAPSLLNAMPELGDTVAFLRGNDLREMISLNGPVKAALDDWLTWNRPMLMSSYEYYQYLRDKNRAHL